MIGLYGQVVPKTVGTPLSIFFMTLLSSSVSFVLPFLLHNACNFTYVQRISGRCAQVLL